MKYSWRKVQKCSLSHASIRLAKGHGTYLVMGIYNDDYILGKAYGGRRCLGQSQS